MSYSTNGLSPREHQPARKGLVWGMSDLTSDQTAATAFLQATAAPFVAKFPNSDRILDTDIPIFKSAISSYVVSNVGWTPTDLQTTVETVFSDLCPSNISGDEHIKNIHNVGNGWRLNGTTLNAAAATLGIAVFGYRANKPTGVAGVTGQIGTAISSLFGSPVVVVAFGAGAFILYKFWRSKHPAPAKAKAKR